MDDIFDPKALAEDLAEVTRFTPDFLLLWMNLIGINL
jgi:hypothetical protein